jgi:hypothetical protein
VGSCPEVLAIGGKQSMVNTMYNINIYIIIDIYRKVFRRGLILVEGTRGNASLAWGTVQVWKIV